MTGLDEPAASSDLQWRPYDDLICLAQVARDSSSRGTVPVDVAAASSVILLGHDLEVRLHPRHACPRLRRCPGDHLAALAPATPERVSTRRPVGGNRHAFRQLLSSARGSGRGVRRLALDARRTAVSVGTGRAMLVAFGQFWRGHSSAMRGLQSHDDCVRGQDCFSGILRRQRRRTDTWTRPWTRRVANRALSTVTQYRLCLNTVTLCHNCAAKSESKIAEAPGWVKLRV